MLSDIKALILDRDGTLIEHVHYLSDPKYVRILPGVKRGLKVLRDKKIKLFLHSNQSGVGRNYFSLEKVHECNLRMCKLLDFKFEEFEKVCIATEKPDDTITYRKPSPRFALEVMTEFGLNPSEICHVGDRLSDIVVSTEIGTRAIGVNTGLVNLEEEVKDAGLQGRFPIFNSFKEVIKYIV